MSEKKIWNYFKDKGFSEHGIAGIMGNLYAESGLIPNNLQNTYNSKLNYTDKQYTQKVDNGTYKNFVGDGAGYGIAQWTYWSRKKALLAFANKYKKSIGDLDVQLDFLYQELTTTYPQLLKNLKSANNVQKASDEFLIKFENPAGNLTNLKKTRGNYSLNFYNKYKSKSEMNGMKYSDSNPPFICLQDESTCYQQTSKLNKILGVLWHSTGANNPNLKRYVQPSDEDAKRKEKLELLGTNLFKNDMNHKQYQMGVNAWVGKTAKGEVISVQALPWNFRPWGCGSGNKGSCNDGWIQFEICEDNLKDKSYFDKIYKESCELTAYLLKKYNLNPYDYQLVKGTKVPVITCHAEACSLGFASNHGDILHWFKLYGKNMDNIRDDVAKIMNISKPVSTPKEENNGELQIGDIVKLKEGTTYITGGKIPSWVFNSTLYYRGKQGNNAIISTLKTGAITGVVSFDSFKEKEFKPYQVKITANKLNIRAEANGESAIKAQIQKNQVYTIVKEENGFGELKSGIGWINLQYTSKVDYSNE